jgi:DEAD/DEAH box helicase domain-containing protein
MDQFSLFGGPSQPEKTSQDQPTVLYFDLETLRSADEVGGWGNIKGMGMACGVCYSTKTQDYHIFEENQVVELVNLLRSADLVVGFNHIRFDYEVLRGYSSFDFDKLPSFDMLVDLKGRLGHRVKLDSVAKSTLGIAKSADGLQSLQWVKEGRMQEVIDYCVQDVKVTKEVFEYGRDNQKVMIDNYGASKPVEVDWRLETVVPKQAIVSPQAALL